MGKALYREYRPTKLEDVIGEDQVTLPLRRTLESGKIGHAYIFTGPRGTGKTSVARIFAHAINGFKYEIEDDYVDIIEIDAASNTGVDNVREIREKALIMPTSGKYKIYIIDEVHMLSKSAFNALLKLIEEPPEHIVFIMATTDENKVPETIKSRAHNFSFHLVDQETMIRYIQEVAKKAKIKISDEALEIVAKRGGGSFRDTLSLLDQVSILSDDEITAEIILQSLGLPRDEAIKEVLDAYKKKDVEEITKILKNVLNSGIRPEVLAAELLDYIVKFPEVEFLPLLEELPKVDAIFPEAKLLLALTKACLLKQGTAPAVKKTPAKKPDPVTKVKLAPTAKAKPEPTAESEPKSAIKMRPVAEFDWGEFLEQIKAENSMLANMLGRCSYEVREGKVQIIPPNSNIKRIVEKDSSRDLIARAAGVAISIGEIKSLKNDSSLGKISDIMGEVQEVKDGGDPF